MDFQDVKLTDYLGKYLVLFFYPADFTFVCPTEILAYADMVPEFEKTNCAVLGCSTDTQHVHFNYCLTPRNKGGLGEDLKLPLLSDSTKTISKLYGALIDDNSDDAGLACRATYIIDDKGILRHASLNDLPVGRNPDETLRLVQAFQYTDKHGQVCPAKWTSGDPTMEPNHKSDVTKKYWEEEHVKHS